MAQQGGGSGGAPAGNGAASGGSGAAALPPGTTAYMQQLYAQQALSDDLSKFWQSMGQEVEDHSDSLADFKAQALPLARIKKIMKSDEDVRMISAEAPVLFARACECFIQELTMRAWAAAQESKRRTMQRSDVATAIARTDIFDFLVDIVPREEGNDPAPSAMPSGPTPGADGGGGGHLGGLGGPPHMGLFPPPQQGGGQGFPGLPQMQQGGGQYLGPPLGLQQQQQQPGGGGGQQQQQQQQQQQLPPGMMQYNPYMAPPPGYGAYPPPFQPPQQ